MSDVRRKAKAAGTKIPFATELEYGRWLSVWYQVLRTLPCARRVSCDLWVLPPPEEENDATIYGTYDSGLNVISVVCLPNHYEMIATLMHEMAHAMSAKYNRHHGYRWRRAFVRITEELLGMNPMPLATQLMRERNDQGYRGSRKSALDSAVTVLLTEQRVRLVTVTETDDHGEISSPAALAGGRVIGVDEKRLSRAKVTLRGDPGPWPGCGVADAS